MAVLCQAQVDGIVAVGGASDGLDYERRLLACREPQGLGWDEGYERKDSVHKLNTSVMARN